MEFKWIKKKLLLRDLIPKLEAHPNVLQVKKSSHHLAVKFDTGITEYWNLTKKPVREHNTFKLPLDRELFVDQEIPVFRQFETNPLYPDEYEILKSHFIIKKKDLDKAGWCDVRFKAHDLAVELVEEGYIPLKYTDEMLKADWEKLKNENVERYQSSMLRFQAFESLPPSGRRLVLHFMPCIAEVKWGFYPLYRTINQLLHKNVTREDVVYQLARNEHVIRHPAFYRAIFREHLDMKGKLVYDLTPDWGFKALGIMAEGGIYHSDSPFNKYLGRMADFVGGEVGEPSADHYDLIIMSDVRPVNLMEVYYLIGKYRPIADHMMIVVKKEDRAELVERYKPWRMLRVQDGITGKPIDDNYLMIIRS